MYINVIALTASLALMCSSNAGIFAAPLVSEHQPGRQIQRRAPRLPAGITVGELIAATAAGVGLSGVLTSALKSISEPRKPDYGWDSGRDKGEENVVGVEVDDDIGDVNHQEKIIVVNDDKAANEN